MEHNHWYVFILESDLVGVISAIDEIVEDISTICPIDNLRGIDVIYTYIKTISL